MKLGIIGGGAWGTALAQVAAEGGRQTLLWAIEDDVVAPNGAAMVGAADVIRVANVLQHGYFSDEQIEVIVRNIKQRCRPGGIIIVCRNHPDRIEASGEDFHRRVDEGFLALAAADPHRWVVIDGDGPIDEVADKVWAALQSHSLP